MTADERMIDELTKRLENAWNAADHAAFAAEFADDAIFIHIYGGQLDGRPAIEEAHQFIFNGILQRQP